MKRLKKEFKTIAITALCLSLVLLVFTVSFAGATTIDVGGINPVIVLESLSAEQAVAGGEFTLTVAVKNISNNPGLDLAFSFKVKDTESTDPFTLLPNQVTTIDQLDGNSTRTVMLKFSVAPEAQNKDYQFVVSLSGKNASMQSVVSAVSIFTIPVTYDLTKPVLIVKEVGISPENPDLTEGFDVHFQIWNLSKTTDARNVVLLLDGKDNFEIQDISNKKNIASLEKNIYETVTYRLKAKDTKADNTVKLKMDFDYLGAETESVEEIVNLPLPGQDVAIGATPWVIINKYTLSDERVLAGNTVTLHLYVENTNQRPVKNVKISLDVVKIESTTSGTSSVTTGGTVFSPVNSSNSFYVDYIPGKTVIQKDIDLYVDPNATAKTYIVPVTIKYEDRKGTTLTCEELVNIPVTQECKLQILSAQIPTNGFAGQPIPVVSEFVNVGKVVLGNFMVALEGEYTKENGTYYIGNLDIGASEYFQGSIIPQQEGALEGTLVFSYIDNNNQTVREEKPFTIDVQARPEPVMGPDGLPTGKDSGGKVISGRNVPVQQVGFIQNVKNKAPFVFLGLIIIFEAVYIWRLKKKKAGEEFFNE